MDEHDLHWQVQAFVRGFGLLDRNHTPCGQPMPASHAHALQVLGGANGLTQQALAEQLNLDKSTTSRLVAQLADRGWLAKSVNPANRREARLALTEAGRLVLADLNQAAAAKFEIVWERITPAKRTQVLESLSLLTQALKEQ